MSLEWGLAASPVAPALYPTLAVVLLAGGLSTSAMFFVDEATRTYDKQRTVAEEVVMALTSSVLLGGGLFFLLLWCGVYLG